MSKHKDDEIARLTEELRTATIKRDTFQDEARKELSGRLRAEKRAETAERELAALRAAVRWLSEHTELNDIPPTEHADALRKATT